MKIFIAPGKEFEWTIPLIENPSQYLGGAVSPELEENHPIAAIAQRGKLMAESMASGNPVAESRIIDVYSRGDPIQRLEELCQYAKDGGLSNGNKNSVDVPQMPYHARGTIAPSDEFYVLPVYENGQRSTRRILRQNEKMKLIQDIWQALPPGYGVGIGDNLFGCQYYLSDGPSTELIDVEVFGDSAIDVVKGIVPFASRDYKWASFHSEEPTLTRQMRFVLGLGRDGGHNNRVATYRRNTGTSMKKAKREIQELVDARILGRVWGKPWTVKFNK